MKPSFFSGKVTGSLLFLGGIGRTYKKSSKSGTHALTILISSFVSSFDVFPMGRSARFIPLRPRDLDDKSEHAKRRWFSTESLGSSTKSFSVMGQGAVELLSADCLFNRTNARFIVLSRYFSVRLEISLGLAGKKESLESFVRKNRSINATIEV